MKYNEAQGDVFAMPLYNTVFQSSWVKTWCTKIVYIQNICTYMYISVFFNTEKI